MRICIVCSLGINQSIKVIYMSQPDAVCLWAQVMVLHQDAAQLSIVQDPPNAPAIVRALFAILEVMRSVFRQCYRAHFGNYKEKGRRP